LASIATCLTSLYTFANIISLEELNAYVSFVPYFTSLRVASFKDCILDKVTFAPSITVGGETIDVSLDDARFIISWRRSLYAFDDTNDVKSDM
jgi:hypothetical protein